MALEIENRKDGCMRTSFLASLAQKGQPNIAKMAKCLVVCILMAISGVVVSPVYAQHQPSATREGAAISLQTAPSIAQSLLAETITLEADEHLIFLSIDLNEGWKTYWRLPGRFGLAPEFDWQNSDNLASARVVFPEPHLFEEADGMSIGYNAPTLWPIIIAPERPDMPIQMRLTLDIGLCAKLCLPERVELSSLLSELRSQSAVSMAQLFALASKLAAEHRDLNDVVLDLEGDMLRVAPLPETQSAAFTIAENEHSHALLIPTDGRKGILEGYWPHEIPPSRLTVIFEEGRMQIFEVIPVE